MKADTYTELGVPVVRGTNISDTRAWKGDWVHIPEELADRMKRCLVFAGDLVLPHRGSIGEVAIIPDDERGRYFISSSLMKITLDREKIEPLFCYYFLRSAEGRSEILRFSSSVGTPGIGQPLTSLRQFKVPVPPLPEQRAIAATLGALDDKIELNRKMNATLEAMARALFRDWFVDFGPTRAKAEERAPYLSPDLWSLFPDRLNDDGKPVGWEVFRLEQIAEHHKRAISPSAQPERIFEHFSLPAFDKGQCPALDRGETIKSNKTLVPPDSVLLSKLNPEIPRVWLPEAAGDAQQIASTEFLSYTGRNGTQRALLFCLFSDDRFRDMLQSMVTGTSKSHQRISPPDLLRREVLTGCPDMFAALEAMIEPLLNRVLANRAESRTLARTRDQLLPRLMSGELRVAEAETLASEVA